MDTAQQLLLRSSDAHEHSDVRDVSRLPCPEVERSSSRPASRFLHLFHSGLLSFAVVETLHLSRSSEATGCVCLTSTGREGRFADRNF
ncbi:Hypothetical protein SMAX5B_015122 [Scophthalmus maximus]|uniref:Uncharacterized protein n=1 Tax=Scophthalmus maximus TaxID=52904 RepID=A0A2U9CFP1_SCOMX|nr:Hypothetical protein SMAX5B_015122 [Scophthalmus maximus]